MSNIESNKKTPGYVAFAQALSAQFERMGIPLVPVIEEGAKDGLRGPADWVCFEVQGSGDKLYCNRTAKGDPTKVETTVPFADIPTDLIAEDMRGRNGKIEVRVKADVELIATHLLPVLAKRHAAGAKIRAAKLPARAAQG